MATKNEKRFYFWPLPAAIMIHVGYNRAGLAAFMPKRWHIIHNLLHPIFALLK